MIQQNGQPAQVVQIQRTSDDRCEIIVQPTEMQDTTTHYYTEDGMKKKPTDTHHLNGLMQTYRFSISKIRSVRFR